MGFPTFMYDSNAVFGEVDSVEEFDRFVEVYVEDRGESRQAALEYMLNATNVESPEAREWPEGKAGDIGKNMEKWGRIPNFGYRIEHLGGKITLREWLRVKGVLGEIENVGEN